MFADDATACDMREGGLTGFGIVFHVGWHLFGWCFSVAFHVYLSNAKVSPMVPAQRGKLMIHSCRITRLGNSEDSRREGEDEQSTTLGGHIVVEGGDSSMFVFYV